MHRAASFPGARLIAVDGFATPRARWHTDTEFRRRVIAE